MNNLINVNGIDYVKLDILNDTTKKLNSLQHQLDSQKKLHKKRKIKLKKSNKVNNALLSFIDRTISETGSGTIFNEKEFVKVLLENK